MIDDWRLLIETEKNNPLPRREEEEKDNLEIV